MKNESPGRAAAPSLLLTLLAGGWCWWTTGGGLGLFLGALLLVTIYLPLLTLAISGRGRWVTWAVSVLGTCGLWLASIASVDITAGEWLRCCVVLLCYAWALVGLTALLRSAGIAPCLAGGVVVLLGLLWLTWPVWLSPWLTQTWADWLVPAAPVFAMNSVLRHLGTWDHASIAYASLTVLNQDVPYHLPGSIAPTACLHGAIGSAGMILCARRRQAPSSPAGSSDASSASGPGPAPVPQ